MSVLRRARAKVRAPLGSNPKVSGDAGGEAAGVLLNVAAAMWRLGRLDEKTSKTMSW